MKRFILTVLTAVIAMAFTACIRKCETQPQAATAEQFRLAQKEFSAAETPIISIKWILP